MKFSLGCEVPFPEKIVESYELGENYIRANVSLDVAPKLLSHFISFPKYLNQEEPPLFFFLEREIAAKNNLIPSSSPALIGTNAKR